jgi:hypothetical protein
VVSPSPSYCLISDGSATNPLVAFYDIHGGKREMLFFYFVPDITRDGELINCSITLLVRYVSHCK